MRSGSDPSTSPGRALDAAPPGTWYRSPNWLEGTAVGVALVSVLVLFVTGFVALPLSVDGGWYSYPAFAWSLGRDPFSNQLSLEMARQLDGLAAIFDFQTTSSLRVVYGAAWFRLFGADLASLRALSVLEFVAGAFAAYALFRAFMKDRSLALLATALLLTDKSFIMAAATDFRPDVALLAASCGLYAVLVGGAGEHWRTATASLLAVVAAGIAITAAVPFAFVFVAAGIHALRTPEQRRARIVQVAVVGTVALVAFLWRQDFFYWFLDPAVPISDPVDTGARIGALLREGPGYILAKEGARLSDYFWVSNMPLALAIGLLVATLVIRGTDGRRVPGTLVGPLAGLLAASLVLGLLDPHLTGHHLLPVMPFVLLLATKLERVPSAVPRTLFALLVLLSGLAGIALGARQLLPVVQSGEGNGAREAALEALFVPDSSYTVVGATELWPLVPADRDVVIADLTRGASRLDELELDWGTVDYVLLSQDYDAPSWLRALEEMAGVAPCVAIDQPPYLVAASPRPCPN